MPIPTLSETTSILARVVGIPSVYQMAGADLPSGEAASDFTIDTLTFTEANSALADGDEVIVVQPAGLDLPAPLVSGTSYFVRDYVAPAPTCKLAATSGGAAITLTDDGGGNVVLYRVDGWSVDGLPDGLTLNAALGRIEGAPTEAGVFVCLARARNSTGVSLDHEFAIGVEPNKYFEDGSIEFDINLMSGQVRVPTVPVLPASPGAASSAPEGGTTVNVIAGSGGAAPANDAAASSSPSSIFESSSSRPAPVFHAKFDDEIVFGIGFYKGASLIDLPLALLNFGIKEYDSEAVILLNDGTWNSAGSPESRRFETVVSFDKAKLGTILDNHEEDEGTYFDFLAEVEFAISYEDGGTLRDLKRTTLTFIIRIYRDLISS